MTAIRFDAVTFFYPGAETPALSGVSMEIPDNAFVGVVGAGNAGKSTLCAAISGIVPGMYPGRMEGRVTLDGQALSGPAGSRVGMVLQNPAHQISGLRFTVFEEVAFGLENLGMERSAIRQKVTEALAVTGLAELADRSPHQLSGGQQQRMAIAAALAGDPDILVLDAPTTFLDPVGGEQIFALLAELHRQGKTIVIAEHRLEWLAEYAGRIIALKNGQKVLDGPPEKVLTAPQLKEIGLEWTRYTRAAALARAGGLWRRDRTLPASFAATVRGFRLP